MSDVRLRSLIRRDHRATRRIRARVAEAVTSDVHGVVLDDLLLATTELVTNALRHGRGRLLVEVRVMGETVRVEISDDGPGFGLVPEHYGMGLLLVSRVADRVGNRRGERHTVWFELSRSSTRSEFDAAEHMERQGESSTR